MVSLFEQPLVNASETSSQEEESVQEEDRWNTEWDGEAMWPAGASASDEASDETEYCSLGEETDSILRRKCRNR